jgi:hypothetical protein
MVGAGVAASYAGWIRQGTGDYFWAWMTAGALCLAAALMCISIPRIREPEPDEQDDPAPTTSEETAQI